MIGIVPSIWTLFQFVFVRTSVSFISFSALVVDPEDFGVESPWNIHPGILLVEWDGAAGIENMIALIGFQPRSPKVEDSSPLGKAGSCFRRASGNRADRYPRRKVRR